MASVGPTISFNENGQPLNKQSVSSEKATLGDPLVFNQDGTLYTYSNHSSVIVVTVVTLVTILALSISGFFVYKYRQRKALRARLKLPQARSSHQIRQPLWETASEMMKKIKNEASQSSEAIVIHAKKVAQDVKEGVPSALETIQKHLPKIPFQKNSEYDNLSTFHEMTDEEDESVDLIKKQQVDPNTVDLEAYLPARLSRSNSRHAGSALSESSSVSDHHQVWRDKESLEPTVDSSRTPVEPVDATLWSTPLPLLTEMANQDATINRET